MAYVKKLPVKVMCDVPGCGKEVIGLRQHKQLAHGIFPNKCLTNPLVNLSSPPEAITPQVKQTEANMAETPCLHCKEKDEALHKSTLQTEDLEKQVKELAGKVAIIPDLQTKASRVAQLEKENEELKKTDVGVTYPTVKDFVAHCEGGSCEHNAQWKTFKNELAGKVVNQAIDGLTADEVKELAVKRGVLASHRTLDNFKVVIPQGAKPGDTFVIAGKDL